MLDFLTSKILNYLLGGSALVLAIALGAVTISKNATINELRTTINKTTEERDAARSDLLTCRGNNEKLESVIDDQNREVRRMKVAGDVRQKLLDGLREDREALGRSARILGTKGETCEDADKLILENVR